MNKRPIVLRLVIALVVLVVFGASMYPLAPRDFYQTLKSTAKNPGDPVLEEVIVEAQNRQKQDADGSIRDSSNRLSRVGLSPSGPVPTVAWEATREGTEDYRLIQLYRDLITRLTSVRQNALEKAQQSLSDADQRAIAKREQALYRKKTPDAPLPNWSADTPEKAAAEKDYLRYLELDRVYRSCKQGQRLLDAVGSLAPAGRYVDESVLRTWYPDLGENNAPDDAEQKRKMLLLYVIRLQNALNE